MTTETVHACPPDGSGVTPCCGRTPFELPRTDRISSEVAVVTCQPAVPVAAPPTTDPTALRERIAETLALRHNGPASDGRGWFRDEEQRQGFLADADAVLAVLPAPADRAAGGEAPLSPDYEHPECGFHWHGRDGMDIPMRDGQPVCPRCELRRVEKLLDHRERRCEELRAESKRRGKVKLEYAEKVRLLERQIDEMRRQLGAEILRAGQAEAELLRPADEEQPATGQSCPDPIECGHEAALGQARGIVRRLAAHAVGFQDVLDDSDRDPWARTVGADIAGLRAALADEQPADEVEQAGGPSREATEPQPETQTALRAAFGRVLRHWGLLDEQIDQKAAEEFAVTDLLALLPEQANPDAEIEHLRDRLASCRERVGIAADKVIAAEDTVERVRQARRRLTSALIAVEPLLTTPYPDDPRWTPWTRFVGPALKGLTDALRTGPDAVEAQPETQTADTDPVYDPRAWETYRRDAGCGCTAPAPIDCTIPHGTGAWLCVCHRLSGPPAQESDPPGKPLALTDERIRKHFSEPNRCLSTDGIFRCSRPTGHPGGHRTGRTFWSRRAEDAVPAVSSRPGTEQEA